MTIKTNVQWVLVIQAQCTEGAAFISSKGWAHSALSIIHNEINESYVVAVKRK